MSPIPNLLHMLGLTANVTVCINLRVGAEGNVVESAKATGAGYDFGINHTLLFLSILSWCIVLSAPWPVSLLLSSSIYLLQQLLSKLINLSVFLSQAAGRRPLSGHHLCGNVQQHADTLTLTYKNATPFSDGHMLCI